MEKKIEFLLDKYYKMTGDVGLWNTGLFTQKFIEWLINNYTLIMIAP